MKWLSISLIQNRWSWAQWHLGLPNRKIKKKYPVCTHSRGALEPKYHNKTVQLAFFFIDTAHLKSLPPFIDSTVDNALQIAMSVNQALP